LRWRWYSNPIATKLGWQSWKAHKKLKKTLLGQNVLPKFYHHITSSNTCKEAWCSLKSEFSGTTTKELPREEKLKKDATSITTPFHSGSIETEQNDSVTNLLSNEKATYFETPKARTLGSFYQEIPEERIIGPLMKRPLLEKIRNWRNS